MIITLKNDKKVDLQWNFIVLEYLEDYTTNEGSGIQQLKKDINAKKNQLKINNHFLYSILRANVDEPLTYRDALTLIKMSDYEKIIRFIEKNFYELDNFKKKGRKSGQGQRKKSKR